MKKLFAENRLVFMGGNGPENSGGAEKLKSAAEMPDTNELSYDFAKKLIKLEKSGDETVANPNRLVKFINSSARTKLRTAAKWVQSYAKKEGYKLSKSNIVQKAKAIADFYNPRKNRQLRAHIGKFMKRAIEDGQASKEEMENMKKLVSGFSTRVTEAMKKVIDSHSVQSIDAGAGGKESNNRSSVLKRYLPTFKRVLKGTGISVSASGTKIEASTSDVEETAKRIKEKTRRDKIVASIMRYQKPIRVASR